jgi:hypothetical protein
MFLKIRSKWKYGNGAQSTAIKPLVATSVCTPMRPIATTTVAIPLCPLNDLRRHLRHDPLNDINELCGAEIRCMKVCSPRDCDVHSRGPQRPLCAIHDVSADNCAILINV